MQPQASTAKREIVIKGKTYVLEDAVHLIATGGQARLYRLAVDGVLKAIKIYIAPNRNTLLKVRFMISAKGKLPSANMIWPEEFVTDPSGNIIGFVMALMPERFKPLAKILESKALREKIKLSQVIRALMKLHPVIQWLHDNNIICADVLTTNNICFDELGDFYLIDLDSLESGELLCTVVTPPYIPPEFPVADLGRKPVFTKEFDWYAYTAIVFEMIFGWPPFGGPHPKYQNEDYLKRAIMGAWVFDPLVRVGTVPDRVMASERLFAIFERMFIGKERFAFPLTVLEEYLTMLSVCKSCGKESPDDIDRCPFCHKPKSEEVMRGDNVTTLLDLTTNVLAAGSINNRQLLVALTVQAGETWVHRVANGQKQQSRLLDVAIPDTSRVEFCGRCLVISQPETNFFGVFDAIDNLRYGIVENCASSQDNWLLWATNARRVFFVREHGTDGELKLYRAIPHKNGLKEEEITSISKNVARIAPLTNAEDSPVLVIYESGSYQIYNAEGKATKRTKLSSVPKGQHAVRFLVDPGNDHLLVRRVCHGGNTPVVLTDIVTHQGTLDFSKVQPLGTYPSAISLQTGMYQDGFLLHANPRGVIKEDVRTSTLKLLAATANAVRPPTRLFWHLTGIGVIYPQMIEHISLTS